MHVHGKLSLSLSLFVYSIERGFDMGEISSTLGACVYLRQTARFKRRNAAKQNASMIR
jgi:hypothetical protein